MIKYFTCFLLIVWPLLQLVKIFTLEGGLFGVDLLKPFPILLLCMAFPKILFSGKRIVIGWPFYLWIIYFLYLLLNSWINGSAVSTLRLFTDQYNVSFMPLVFYFIIENFGEEFNRKVLAYSVLASGAIMAGIGIAEALAGQNLIGDLNYEATRIQSIYRTNGPFQEGIGYSTIVLLYVPFAYYYMKEEVISKTVYFIFFAVFSMGLLVTLARASMISYLIIMIVLMSGSNMKTIIMNMYLSIIILVGLYLSWEVISSSSIFTKRLARMSNVVGRWKQYIDCLNIFITNPFFGIGYGVYKTKHFYFIHNSYLKQLAELGILGFLTHGLFIVSVAFSKFKKSFFAGNAHFLKTRLCFIVILAIVPNTIDLLSNQYFTLMLFVMIAAVNMDHKNSEKAPVLVA